ncbi:hypothetical protein GBAR_LOCUS22574 [Geodia barretti]|uniref:Uncharacterized protein n=1 Tax=Geodia barretti TaxID=519541 RepID=A0AA35X7I6_GEOBA|nr:hypothetical protein GBAR_LOCUS22574 [Geodia barretti]
MKKMEQWHRHLVVYRHTRQWRRGRLTTPTRAHLTTVAETLTNRTRQRMKNLPAPIQSTASH